VTRNCLPDRVSHRGKISFKVPLGRLERPTRGLGMRLSLRCLMFSHYATAYCEAEMAYYCPPTTAKYCRKLRKGLANGLAEQRAVHGGGLEICNNPCFLLFRSYSYFSFKKLIFSLIENH